MARRSCPGCRERDARIAVLQERVHALEAEVGDLRARLGQNARNSSVPPSANPAGAPKPVVKQPTGRQPGAQPGHHARLRRRLPPERLRRAIRLVPRHCERCRASLPAQAGPHDPEPSWHQVQPAPQRRECICSLNWGMLRSSVRTKRLRACVVCYFRAKSRTMTINRKRPEKQDRKREDRKRPEKDQKTGKGGQVCFVENRESK